MSKRPKFRLLDFVCFQLDCGPAKWYNPETRLLRSQHPGRRQSASIPPALPSVFAMSETSGLRFQQAYDEARASITSSLNSVKDTYEGIQREFGDEMKGNDLKGKDLIASLHKATSEIEGLNGVVKTLEASLAASKDLAATAQKTLQVRTDSDGDLFCTSWHFCLDRLPVVYEYV